MSLKWFYNRLKLMSLPEILFRIGEQGKHRIDSNKRTGFFPPPINKVNSIKIFDDIEFKIPLYDSRLEIFDTELDYTKGIDWHLDLKSNSHFPLSNSSKIDIRTSRHGSAKHVWEVNRLSFMVQICMNYQQSREKAYLEQFINLIKDWIKCNPYLLGVNWYSNIEVNIRLINWFVCWEILDVQNLITKKPGFKAFVANEWLPLIYLHCRHSRRYPSLYSSANNHLISEYAGLFIATSLWKFKESEKWNSYAKKGLEKEIILQHTNDGINREQASEYIQFITDFFLLSYIVGEKTNNQFSNSYKEMLVRIVHYIFEFTDNEGNYPKYGDEDDGQLLRFNMKLENNFLSILHTSSVIFNLPDLRAKNTKPDVKSRLLLGKQIDTIKQIHDPVYKLSTSSKLFRESGHFILRNNDRNKRIYIHLNAAPLGYLSIAAHGHADALSFVLHLNENPVFIDPGTFSYHTDPEWRKYFISTLAHNTVCVNGLNQAAFGGSTMWITKYNCQIHDIVTSDTEDRIDASHDGYKRTGIVHKRNFHFLKQDKKLVIEDYIESETTKDILVEIPFHLHPDVKLKQEGNKYILNSNNNLIHMNFDNQLTPEIYYGSKNPILGWYSESFQKIKPTSVIVCRKLIKATETFRTEISILEN